MVRETGIDLADHGGDAYALLWSLPWPTGKLAAAD
jgi:hypothetical protein